MGKQVREKQYGEKTTGKNSTGNKKYRKKSTGNKSAAKKVRPDRTSSGHLTLSLPVKKAPLRRILRNFGLHMCRTYFRTGPLPVTSLPVTSGQAYAMVRSSGSSANVAWTVPIYYCHKSKDRQTKKDKMINSVLQKTTQKTED